MAEFPLLPVPAPVRDRRPGGPRGGSRLRLPGRARQGERLQPVFQRLRDVFEAGRDPVTLRDDPAGIAPERALGLDVAGGIGDFYRATQRIGGLEYLGEEETELDADQDFAELDTRRGRKGKDRADKPVVDRLYLAMPDTRALQELLRLWDRYQSGEQAVQGFGPWFDLFNRLRQLRAWGPLDRVPDSTISWLAGELEARTDSVQVEIELWSHQDAERHRRSASRFEQAAATAEGRILSRASIPEIAYEAALVELPAAEVRRLANRDDSPIAICDAVMFIRPQSIAQFPIAVDALGAGGTVEPAPTVGGTPISALFDGVPVLGHRLLDGRVRFDDPDDLEAISVVAERRHGTEMASLILHGDRNVAGPSLQRPLYVRPVLYAPGGGVPERTQPDRLLIDTIYRAVLRMRTGDPEGEAAAPEVFLVNLSLGDQNRPFTGPMSPWGRLLDHLADRFGILFLVSAGNVTDPLPVPAFSGLTDLEQASPADRERAVFEALARQQSRRTLLSPAEALNVITVGAWHEDAVDAASHPSLVFAPYEEDDPGPNVTSALGLGHRKAIKPDIFMPGGRELFSPVTGGAGLRVRPAKPGRFFGLKAAIPDADGRLDQEGLTMGTSAATALATRDAHRLFDALMDEDNGAILSGAAPEYYGVMIKALLAHRAHWGAKGSLLDELYGPKGQGKHVERKDNIARVLGYGRPLVEETMTCAANRAILVGCGSVASDESANLYRAPLPVSLERVTEPRSITMTLAWFSPVNVRHRAYRRAKLEIQPLDFKTSAGVSRVPEQPSDKSVPRGSLFHVRYQGNKAVSFIDDGHIQFRVYCREQAGPLDQAIRYGLAVTVEAGEGVPVYREIRQRLGIQPRP